MATAASRTSRSRLLHRLIVLDAFALRAVGATTMLRSTPSPLHSLQQPTNPNEDSVYRTRSRRIDPHPAVRSDTCPAPAVTSHRRPTPALTARARSPADHASCQLALRAPLRRRRQRRRWWRGGSAKSVPSFLSPSRRVLRISLLHRLLQGLDDDNDSQARRARTTTTATSTAAPVAVVGARPPPTRG